MNNLPNIEPGMVYYFECCIEGRKIVKTIYDSNGKKNHINQDDINVGIHHRHPFLIISQISSDSNYITALPITTSNSNFTQKNGKLIDRDMIDEKGTKLVSNQSSIKFIPMRLFLKNLSVNADRYQGSFYERAYLNIISEVVKRMNASKILIK
jgi:hypothetical protein